MRATKLVIKGIVQGVGFRPAVYKVATQMGYKGWVKNTSAGVEIIINTLSFQSFIANLKLSLPPLAIIDSVNETEVELADIYSEFIIEANSTTTTNETTISTDSCICSECINDIFNPKSKYYLYPFTSCSNCGPRYSIIANLPYSRAKTALANFPLCASCHKEFTDPANRRHNAETIVCKNCGPALSLDLADVAKSIQSGNIVALKTTGGYTLITDANNIAVIKRLRERKIRTTKPFALMALNTQSIRDYYCQVNPAEQQLLESVAAPIVILNKHKTNYVADEIAPNLNTLGFMLPHHPIYYLLFFYLLGKPDGTSWLYQSHKYLIIVTSANLSGGSIISEDKKAEAALAGIADVIVGYNRDIIMKCDDSVVLPVGEYTLLLRRSRGFVPSPYTFKYTLPTTLGLGAHLKNTICFTQDNHAHLSQYLGNMDSEDVIKNFHQVIKHYQQIYNFIPELVVSDLHKDFYTTIYGSEYDVPHLCLQHHFAHMAATMASYQSCGGMLQSQVIGCILDGYGYGTDGMAWGGELIQFNSSELSFTRLSHLPYITIPGGGDTAEREPWKLAMAWCLEHDLPIPDHITTQPQITQIEQLITRKYTIQTSSCGRLFSLVSALLNVCCHNSYEAEAALNLECLVTTPQVEDEYVRLNQLCQPDISLLVERIYHIAYSENNKVRAVNVFYANLAALLAQWIIYYSKLYGISQVALGGGCWQSRYLLPLVKQNLLSRGIELLIPYRLPFNDECISFGQAWYGAQYLLSGRT